MNRKADQVNYLFLHLDRDSKNLERDTKTESEEWHE